MSNKAERMRKLSVFTYFFILLGMIIVTILLIKELDISSNFEEILYQRDLESTVVQENKYYIKKIKEDYGIRILYGENEENFISSVNAVAQYDENIVNNNLKLIYEALEKYPEDVFDIFKEENYTLYLIIVDEFTDNNIAMASKNTLNQFRIYISNNEKFERAFHHEFFHVMEYYMADNVKYLYSSWNLYNPQGFTYESDVSNLTDDNVYNENLSYEENASAYFLSKYSKVSEKEDRAEIFAEIMMAEDKKSYFEKGSRIREKINYLLNEIHENITISDFNFSTYLE